MSAPPWKGSGAPPERTAEGVEIIHTRFGPHIRNPDGQGLLPYETPEAEFARLFRQRQAPAAEPWSVWDNLWC